MHGTHDTRERSPRRHVTLGDVIAAVIEVADDEREVTAVVVQMLRNGSVRLRRPCAVAGPR